MARKKKEAEHANHERWLVSYADFITLLFAFFVVMFASSQADKGKAQQVSDSVKKALEGEKMSAVIAAVLGGAVDNRGQGSAQKRGPAGEKLVTLNKPGKDVPEKDMLAKALLQIDKPGKEQKDQQEKNQQEKDKPKKEEEKLAELSPSLRILSQELKTEVEAGRIQINMESRGLVVSFTQAALFPSGEDTIAPEAIPSLGKIAAAMAKIPNPVRLEGHTDSHPIKTTRFHSNWDLSAARSIVLLDILTSRFRVPAGHISVAGYADTAPIASNETEEGRARNRRVDIVILNEQGVLGEPSNNSKAATDGKAGTGGAGARSLHKRSALQ